MDVLEVQRLLLARDFRVRTGALARGWWAIYTAVSDAPAVIIDGLGVVEKVDADISPGDMYLVVRITADDGTVRHYRVTGYWDSWDSRWDGHLHEVTPTTKLVTSFTVIDDDAA
ncbi:hypothetical protein [Nocardia sp. NPDC050435]|uniref:hypothetical protein n=1 Tax=Nocardia sp. NPDC050435 TaxID=3155040 RepID=UPI0033CCA375